MKKCVRDFLANHMYKNVYEDDYMSLA